MLLLTRRRRSATGAAAARTGLSPSGLLVSPLTASEVINWYSRLIEYPSWAIWHENTPALRNYQFDATSSVLIFN